MMRQRVRKALFGVILLFAGLSLFSYYSALQWASELSDNSEEAPPHHIPHTDTDKTPPLEVPVNPDVPLEQLDALEKQYTAIPPPEEKQSTIEKDDSLLHPPPRLDSVEHLGPSIDDLYVLKMRDWVEDAAPGAKTLLPMPHSVVRLDTSPVSFDIRALTAANTLHPHLQNAYYRLIHRLERSWHRILPPITSDTATPLSNHTLSITYSEYVPLPYLGVDESYELLISPEDGITISATTSVGILHAFETFIQWVTFEGGRIVTVDHTPAVSMTTAVPSVHVTDAPRFRWRGLMLDIARHFHPPDAIRRNIDAMASVKLNVLHLHLSDDQGYRLESEIYPLLQTRGGEGQFLKRKEVIEIVEYAAARGIRVVPEIDMPGHVTAILAAYPALAPPGFTEMSEPERHYGVFKPCFDVSKPEVFAFVANLVNETAALFPDRYFHIGGDEVDGTLWSRADTIRRMKAELGLGDNHDVQRYFNVRVNSEILQPLSKIMVGWDEILCDELPRSITIQSWRGANGLRSAARMGFSAVLSAGFYLDHVHPASEHYRQEPLDGVDPPEKVLGGEACMWCEYVSTENLDSRLWPRMTAVAERFWSSMATRDADDMYRRLDAWAATADIVVSTDLTYRTYLVPMCRRLARGDQEATEALVSMATILEPQNRVQTPSYTTLTPLTGLIDTLAPESAAKRHLARIASILAKDGWKDEAKRHLVRGALEEWSKVEDKLKNAFAAYPELAGHQSMALFAHQISEAAAAALQALDYAEGKASELSSKRVATFGDHHLSQIFNRFGSVVKQFVESVAKSR